MATTVIFGRFEWDQDKANKNERTHGIDFYAATLVFLGTHRIIAVDEAHSEKEPRYFCLGKIGRRILTVRLTPRKSSIRIIGAGFWRQGRRLYEKKNK